MAANAVGEPVETETGVNQNSDPKKSTSTGSKVTRNIKGRKEFVFAFPNAEGKGYPAAVGMTM